MFLVVALPIIDTCGGMVWARLGVFVEVLHISPIRCGGVAGVDSIVSGCEDSQQVDSCKKFGPWEIS